MRYGFFILTINLLLSSCASISNQPSTSIDVFTAEPSAIIVASDTFKTVKNKSRVFVPRNNKTLQMTVINQASDIALSIEPKKSLAYWANIPCNFGLGMLVDKNTIKQFGYPKRIYLDSPDSSQSWYRFSQIDRTNDFRLKISLPWVNFFSLRPEGESRKSNAGFWGISVGLDYFHRRDQFINLSASAVMDLFVPVPGAIDIEGEYELMSSGYLSLSNNHKTKRWTFGYGVAYGINTWDLSYSDHFDPPPPTRDPVKKSHQFLGILLSSYFQINEHFSTGLIYRPTIVKLDPNMRFEYEHLISIDFAWSINLSRK